MLSKKQTIIAFVVFILLSLFLIVYFPCPLIEKSCKSVVIYDTCYDTVLKVDTLWRTWIIYDTIEHVDTVKQLDTVLVDVEGSKEFWAYIMVQQKLQEYFKGQQVYCDLYSVNRVDTIRSFGSPFDFEPLFSSGFKSKVYYVFEGSAYVLSADSCILTKYFYKITAT